MEIIKNIVFFIVSFCIVYECIRLHRFISRFNYKMEYIELVDDLHKFLYEED